MSGTRIMSVFFPRLAALLSAASMVFLLSSCSFLKQQAEVIKPTAKLTGASLSNINFDQADLVFDLAVENKNPVALDLSGLKYDFQLDGNSLVSGVTSQGIKLKANGTSTVKLPVSVVFDDLKKLGTDIWTKDSLKYNLDTTFMVKLPIIGDYAVPVTKEGDVPVPKIPSISVKGVKLKKMGFTAADLVAQIEVSNPNNFDLGLNKLDYNLNVNDSQWGAGKVSKATNVPKKGKAVINIPVTLDLLKMGTAAMNLINSQSQLNYQLTGNANIDTALELFKNVDVPLDIKGSTSVR